MRSTSKAADVAIIGAGPAGLTAAYLLTKAGYSVIVLEKDHQQPQLGGGIQASINDGQDERDFEELYKKVSFVVTGYAQ